MTTRPLYPATTFASASYKTPFGYFDDDSDFRTDANKMTEYVRRRLGGASVTAEITDYDTWACMEDATLEFFSIVSIYQARDLALDMIGTPSGSVSTVKLPHHSNRLLQHYAAPYAHFGQEYTLHSASVTFQPAQQTVDIRGPLVTAGKISGSDIMRVKDVWYASNVQVYRLFNTTSVLNYLNREFSFSSYVPEVMFYLLPVWEDVLRVQEFKMSDIMRRSNYSYRIQNGMLSIYPAPTSAKTVWYTYVVEPNSSIYGSEHYTNYLAPSGSVTNVSNMPITLMPYSSLNIMSKQFVKKITVALCKELLGRVRSKFMSIPIPNGEVTLDGADLRQEAASELDNLRNDLKEWLESLTHQALLEAESAKQQAIVQSYQMTPLLIAKG